MRSFCARTKVEHRTTELCYLLLIMIMKLENVDAGNVTMSEQSVCCAAFSNVSLGLQTSLGSFFFNTY